MDRVRVNERSAKTVTFTLTDSAGTVVTLATINTAQLTLYDLETYNPGDSPLTGILNNRDLQDVKNANNVTIHVTSGLVTWVSQPDDNVIETPRRQVERHRAEFRFTLTDGTQLSYQVELEVVNMRKAA